MTTVSKNVQFDVLDDIFDKYNNTYQSTIKLKPIDVKSNSYAEYNVDSNQKDPKFKVGDQGYDTNWLEEVFVISKIKNTVPWTYVISDLNGEKIKRKENMLYVKWKGCDNYFNSWIDKRYIV